MSITIVYADLDGLSGAYDRSAQLVVLDRRLTTQQERDVLLWLLTQAARPTRPTPQVRAGPARRRLRPV